MSSSFVYKKLYELTQDDNNYTEKIIGTIIIIFLAIALYYILKKFCINLYLEKKE